jgi:hypothetical protein
MALQLNSILTKSLVTSLVRYGTTSARIILISNAVPIPTDMTTAQLDTYFQSFMLTANTANYLGSFTISAYQNFNNTIVIGTGSATALQSGTVGSIVLTHIVQKLKVGLTERSPCVKNRVFRRLFIRNDAVTK